MVKSLRKCVIGAGLVLASLAAGAVWLAPAASADTGPCNPQSDGVTQVCVVFNPAPQAGALVYGAVTAVPNGPVYPVSDLTQTVYQCYVDGTGCVLITASHYNPTSSKTVATGHAYKNCASYTDVYGIRYTNVCSPLAGVPT